MNEQTELTLRERVMFKMLIKSIDDGRYEIARPMKDGKISLKRVSLTLKGIIENEEKIFISSRIIAETLRVHNVGLSQSISIKNVKMRVTVVNYDLIKEKLGVK